MFLSTELKQTYSSVWGYNYTPNATSPYKIRQKQISIETSGTDVKAWVKQKDIGLPLPWGVV